MIFSVAILICDLEMKPILTPMNAKGQRQLVTFDKVTLIESLLCHFS